MDLPGRIIDLSHWNQTVDLERARDEGGVIAVWHKLTDGLGPVDPASLRLYFTRRDAAHKLGLCWGGYHFGRNHDGAAQWANFRKQADLQAGERAALDWELDAENQMTLSQAERFAFSAPLTLVGYWSSSVFHVPLSSVLRQRARWVALYNVPRRGQPVVAAPPTENWDMWQHTNGEIGAFPVPVPGIAGPCDRSTTRLTVEQFRQWWTSPAT